MEEMKRTGVFVSDEEMLSLRLIQNKISCAAQACDPKNIPNGCPEEKAIVFVKAALLSRAEALFLEHDWWNRILRNNNLGGRHIHIDFSNGELIDVLNCEREK